jgi:GNAT superfamily N-acetyltransferase
MRLSLTSGEPVEITTVAERPELAGTGVEVGGWPAFMRHNRVAEAYFGQLVDVFPDTCLVATTVDGAVVGKAHAVRFVAGAAGREELPAGGWEQVVVWSFADARRDAVPDTACALDISVAASVQGRGLARLMLESLRGAVGDLGLPTLVAPVRPTWKSREPATSMREYAARVREDGLPFDPWLRTHARVGGRIAGLAPTSWLVAGSLAEWRAWTGLPFDQNGGVEVPGALAPVRCDTRADHAIYVEPNVWVRHAGG